MQADPQYREKVLSLLQRDLCSPYAPRAASVMLTVGETLAQYRGDAWPTNNDSEFFRRSQNSIYKKMNNEDADDYERKRMEAHEKMMWNWRYFEQQCQLKAKQKMELGTIWFFRPVGAIVTTYGDIDIAVHNACRCTFEATQSANSCRPV